MHTIETTELSFEQKEAIRSIWNNEYPVKLALTTPLEMDIYLASIESPTHYLAINETGRLIAWAATFTRDEDTWFAIIVDTACQKQGIGRQLLDVLKEKNEVLNGWVADHNNNRKQNGEVYPSPLPFYLKNGFTLIPEIRLELDKLSAVKIRWTRL